MVMMHQFLGYGYVECAGTVLSKRWILTTAHCVERYPRTFLVEFGISDKLGIGYELFRIFGMSMITLLIVSMVTTQAFIHPQYAIGYNDIALLYMPQDIPLSKV
ncbi:chymotrypsin-2-like [Temnothorax curvispinosus]|uniref:Chymotrypsin-2-like n=1 Tax=Temnothorax curvispinosus TaxID=300111 RepID=A0A6J1QR58_9HYME|nr:chymotrypsin-2-like [Temnothorax curvispinosus]